MNVKQAAENARNLARMYKSVLDIAEVLDGIGAVENAAKEAELKAEALSAKRDAAVKEYDEVVKALEAKQDEYNRVAKAVEAAYKEVEAAKVKAESQAGDIYQEATMAGQRYITAAEKDAARIRAEAQAERDEHDRTMKALRAEEVDQGKKIKALQAEFESLRKKFG